MHSNFDYIKMDPQYYFFHSVLDFFSRLLEIKNIIKGGKC